MARPLSKFHEFVGQRRIVHRLERIRQGATAREVPLPHLLFIGASGLGKTELAEALAKAQGTNMHYVDGHSKEEEIANKLQNCSYGDIFFMDEAHQLNAPAQELLYGVIDHAQLPRRVVAAAAEDTDQEPGEFIKVPQVTLILATDQPGKLLNALRKRIPCVEHFRPYSDREMRDIVDTLATRQNILLSPHARNHIARISRGLPRRAVHHLGKLKLYCPNSATEQLDLGMVRQYLRAFEIDSAGLGPTERAYMDKLQASGTASIDTLALSVGLDLVFIRRDIESTLIALDFIIIESHGRQLTDKGRQHLETRTQGKA